MQREQGLRKRGPPSKSTTTDVRAGFSDTEKSTSACQSFLKVVFVFVLLLAVFLCISYARSPISAVSISSIHDIRQFEWAQVENKDLQRGVRILPELIGPESLAIDEHDNLYTALADGRIVKITNPGNKDQTVTDLTKSFDYAKGSKRRKKRPLGIRLHGSKLYFADAYQGVIMIDLKSESYDVIVRYYDVTPSLVFADDLTITSDGKTIYFTDMSLKWSYEELALFALEAECSGRLFKVDVETKRTELVRNGLCHTNGIELDRTETHAIVAEHNRRRLAVISLKSGVVVRHVLLPGGPDNVRRRKDRGYWVSIPYMPEPGHFATWHPVIRNILATILGELGILGWVDLNQGIAVKLDENFEPVSIHYDLEGKLSRAITEISELSDGRLAVGSFIMNGIALVDPLPSD
uniref:adipocyte plasma membrane-associated protein-like n=1 Tax=Styela clava TaxID=7725 RepID=UPI00193A3204|nr:adipocyte plasma membrane-associated protein-like [Styela clava]